ncbi:probable E3 ubiquitin-protein ligase XERICO [Gastrolobium bilobum]|uniref:probable E3 ubiquitin-protein ligase XERICO n=1 Tax=Gastrolobium bilobum TaxID=150636 RepID=UPI002AB10D34|nr:probable E3 ubiquitin-protein ligase XERICO [Gastrolobium bilobum]
MDPLSPTMAYLYDVFSSVPLSSESLESILTVVGRHARDMISDNIEGLDILHMDAIVCTANDLSEEYYEHTIDHHSVFISTLVNSMEKVRFNQDASSNLDDTCSICLEKLRDGSNSKLVRTKCSHVFHEDCITEWLQHCIAHQSYSCPLCRCQITYVD